MVRIVRNCSRLILLAVVSTLIFSETTSRATYQEDATASAIADEVMAALGGREAWDDCRYIDFAFVRRGARLVLKWDRWSRDYRLDARNDEGKPVRVIMNLNSGEGDVYVDDTPLSGEAKSEWLTRATRMWHGESYWFLMPLKLRDPGVQLGYAGEQEIDGTVYDVLHLAFEDVGVTPKDTFRAYIHPETRLMDRWSFKLESGFEGDFRWTNWVDKQGVLVATERHGVDGEVIRMEDITFSHEVPEGVFTRDAP